MATKTRKEDAGKTAAVKTAIADHKIARKHIGHEAHLCELVSKRKMAQVAKAARDARYMCHICGRGANKPANLCEPVEI